MTQPNHVVRSPHCPNNDRKCDSCAWGFVTPQGLGNGEKLSSKSTVVPFQAMPGYRSDCGRVDIFADDQGRIGAVRDGQFFPGIEGNFAFERFWTSLVQIASA